MTARSAGPAYPSTTTAGPHFTPSAELTVSPEGRRDVAVCFLGSSLTSGYGDPRGLGWVGRVVARTSHPDLDLTAYNLGVRGQTSGDVLARWRSECAPRWAGRQERRLVVSVGSADITSGMTTARSRLNLANILDEAIARGIGCFVVGLAPTLDGSLNDRISVLAEAQSDVCARRGVTYVDCFRPLLGHEHWQADLEACDGAHPGHAGYGLLAWLVLHGGWAPWMRIG